MTKEEFKKIMEQASKIIESWPDWKKKNWLSNSPTVKVPRKPIIDEDKIDY